MKLSAPAYRLKRQARILSRKANIPLHAALDRIAQKEGFASWSSLAARLMARGPASKLIETLSPGELVLLAARPGQGKTMLGIELVLESMNIGRNGWFFTLEWNKGDLLASLQTIGVDSSSISERFKFDSSDAICADYIINRLEQTEPGTVVVVDYLQLLDQRRQNPELGVQVTELRAFARVRSLIIVLLSQIDRSYNPAVVPVPRLSDVRLPNPLDLTLFDRTCFMQNGVVQVCGD